MTVLGQTSIAHAPAQATKQAAGGFWLLIALLALIGVGKTIQADTMDPDAFWHLRVADQLLKDGVGPLIDRISFASLKTPWAPYSWLAEIGMRMIWTIGGFRLATVATAVCSAGIIAMIAAAARERIGTKNDLAVAVLTAAAAFFTLPFISFRPVTFALAIMAGIIWLLIRDRQQPTPWVWAIVPITLLLTNIHLYAVIVVAVIWLTTIGSYFDQRSRLSSRVWLAMATTLAACCTPMLRGAIATAISYSAVDPMVASPFITEMRPFYSGGAGKASLILFVLMLMPCVWRRKTLNLTDWLWLALGMLLLFRLGRFSPVFAILATPAIARAFPAISGTALGRPMVRVALWAVLAAGAINILPSLQERDFSRWLNRNNATYPTAAALFVEKSVQPTQHRLINEFNWGGYLAWRLGDQYQVLMDGRTQLYPPEFWLKTHLGTESTRFDFLKETSADAAVLPAHDSAFAEPLRKLGWHEAFRDDLAVVMVPPAS